jgi:hypothetical protein
MARQRCSKFPRPTPSTGIAIDDTARSSVERSDRLSRGPPERRRRRT